MVSPERAAIQAGDVEQALPGRNPRGGQAWRSSHASAPFAAATPVLKQACNK
jgi:hypothetical protein